MFEVNQDSGLIKMYGIVGGYFEDGFDETDVAGALALMQNRPVTVQIKSDGGDVFKGVSIFNQLAHYEGGVSVIVDSLAASIASIIAMAGQEIAIHQHSMLMIHNPWTVAAGDAREFRGVANLLDLIASEMRDIYVEASGQTRAAVEQMMNEDTWLTADQALELGFVHRVIEKPGAKKPDAKKHQPLASACAFPKRTAAARSLRRSKLR